MQGGAKDLSNLALRSTENAKSGKLDRLKVKFKKDYGRNYDLYLMLIPVFIYFFIFWLIPLYGITIGFKDYTVARGVMESPWVGFKHFIRFFNSHYFSRTIINTLGLNLYALLFSFPLTIVLALMFNELRNKKFKNIAQIISYAPNFISVVVVCGMLITFLSPSTGFISNAISLFTGDKVNYLAEAKYFWHIFVWSGIWQGIGFGTILYTAAMSSIPQNLYEAADVDGATKLQKIMYITLPSISSLIVLMFILAIGNIFSLGFDKILLLQNGSNIAASEVISTYVYKQGVMGGQFSYTTAISLFNTAANILILGTASFISKKIRGKGLFD